VADIALSLDARATQVIARMTVVDGTGQPVAGASVAGAWSSIMTNGDTRRDTKAKWGGHLLFRQIPSIRHCDLLRHRRHEGRLHLRCRGQLGDL
jgi:hypothetical protein